MYNGQEKRKYKRKYKRIGKQYMAKFTIRSDEAQEMESNDWDSVILKNVSAEGALFFYNKDLEIGTLLYLKIYVPKAILIINCVGEIARIDKSRSTSMFGLAIKFTEIGEQEKELINKSVEGTLE